MNVKIDEPREQEDTAQPPKEGQAETVASPVTCLEILVSAIILVTMVVVAHWMS